MQPHRTAASADAQQRPVLPAGETFGPEDRELKVLRADAARELERAEEALATLVREAGRELDTVRAYVAGRPASPASRSLGGPAGGNISRAAEEYLFATVRAADLAEWAARREAARAARGAAEPPEVEEEDARYAAEEAAGAGSEPEAATEANSPAGWRAPEARS